MYSKCFIAVDVWVLSQLTTWSQRCSTCEHCITTFFRALPVKGKGMSPLCPRKCLRVQFIAPFITSLWQCGIPSSTKLWSPVALISANLNFEDLCIAATLGEGQNTVALRRAIVDFIRNDSGNVILLLRSSELLVTASSVQPLLLYKKEF